MDIVFFRLTTTIEITLKLITLVGIVNNIDAYGSGAPVSVCQDMTPQHGVYTTLCDKFCQ
jgi:hypothetical protein